MKLKTPGFLIGMLLLILPSLLFCQEQEQELETEIELVKIHLQGAEIIRAADLRLSPGRHRIIFTGLSPKINPRSIQIMASGEVTILSITSKTNFLKETKASPAISRLRDSLELLQARKQDLSDQLTAYQKEMDLLETNRNLSGKEKGLAVDDLVKAAGFYRSRFGEIYKARTSLNREVTAINKQVGKTKQQLSELNASNRPTSEIYLSLSTRKTVSSPLRMRYLINDTGWSPVYDLKAGELDQPIELKYRAFAYNNTGVDWNKVKIILSTGDPNQSAAQPVLQPWKLDYNIQASFNQYQGRLNTIQQSQNIVIAGDDKLDEVPIRFETIEVAELSKDFDIPEPYTIPSDRKPYSIDITSYQLKNVTYRHFAVPKLDRDAFLLAQITGWEDLDLISGPVNIYHKDSYIGLSELNTHTLNDTLDLSLGRDKKVLVKRVKLKEKSQKQFMSSDKKISLAYEISVKNNHSIPVQIEILDQLPVSTQKDVAVKPGSFSDAAHNETTGELKWTYKLNPGEKKIASFDFSVRYPKNKTIQFHKSRKMVTPRYF